MELSAKPLLALASLAALAGCNPPSITDPFGESGELLALSGGDAGAQSACHTCHGLNGEGDGGLTPRLAGMERGYLARQMNFFAEGQRPHARMHWIARRLDPQQQDRVSEYYAGMDWSPPARPATQSCEGAAAQIYHAGDPARGLASCASCHGASGEGMGRGNPALAGQPARYIAAQLEKWRKGERHGDPLGEMRDAARLLADAEIAPLAAYAASLHGLPGDPESPAACPPPRRPDPGSGA